MLGVVAVSPINLSCELTSVRVASFLCPVHSVFTYFCWIYERTGTRNDEAIGGSERGNQPSCISKTEGVAVNSRSGNPQ